ncbi:MAG: 30S ribosomal protein S1 [Lachnospiraceae bacterium]|jgi:small subunit ribosomal protein S1
MEEVKENVETAAEQAAPAAETAPAAEEPQAPAESMDDYKEEVEASVKKVRPGDIVTGTIIAVSDKEVTVDLNSSNTGRIEARQMSADPKFNMADVKVGDEITAKVIREDKRDGSLVLSARDAASELAWDKLQKDLDEKTVLTGTVSEAVKGGLVIFVEGIRGFMPASRVSTGYVEHLEDYVGKEIQFQVIEVKKEDRRVILSAKEILREQEAEKRAEKLASFTVGSVVEGTVESLKDYGAFVNIGDGVTGLLHVSQISDHRIGKPSDVLSVGQKVNVKIIRIENNRVSLSMRKNASASSGSGSSRRNSDDEGPREFRDKGGSMTTNLGDILKGLKI